MKQHNHWKLKKSQKLLCKVALWGSGISLLLLNIVFSKTMNYDLISNSIGIVLLVLGVLYECVERYLWKSKLIQLPLWEDYWTPILEGRWQGSLFRDGVPHEFVLEICQSFTTISCMTYSNHSSSIAYAAEILYNDQTKQYQLIYYWHGNTTTVQRNTGDTNGFDGFTVLNIIIESGKVVKLKGEYFTNRQPKQTKGTLELRFEQKELKNSFK